MSRLLNNVNSPAYIKGAEEEGGTLRANSRTHKQFLRKHKLGKLKKRQTK